LISADGVILDTVATSHLSMIVRLTQVIKD